MADSVSLIFYLAITEQCSVCLLKGTSDCYIDKDNMRYATMTFIDLKKAFDTVDHPLQFYGITEHVQNWSVLILIIGSNTVESMKRLLASKILVSECHRDRA